jgi:mRNA interferase MazF
VIREGQVVLFRFPQTDQSVTKLRPALVLRRLPGPFDDWLISMISSQLGHRLPEFDELIVADDEDFAKSGLKTDSLIRISRLAVAERSILLGTIGEIADDRLSRIKKRLAQWIVAAS